MALFAPMGATMRRGIALAAMAACLGVVALLGAAPASATLVDCPTKPVVNGFTFTSLSEKNITCDHARDRAVHTLHHGLIHHHPWVYDDFHCEGMLVGSRGVSWHCVTPDGHRAFAFAYYVH
jgi:hypothetical protein